MTTIPATREATAMPTPARTYARFQSYVLNVLGDGQPTCDSDNPIEGITWDAKASELYAAHLDAHNAANGH